MLTAGIFKSSSKGASSTPATNNTKPSPNKPQQQSNNPWAPEQPSYKEQHSSQPPPPPPQIVEQPAVAPAKTGKLFTGLKKKVAVVPQAEVEDQPKANHMTASSSGGDQSNSQLASEENNSSFMNSSANDINTSQTTTAESSVAATKKPTTGFGRFKKNNANTASISEEKPTQSVVVQEDASPIEFGIPSYGGSSSVQVHEESEEIKTPVNNNDEPTSSSGLSFIERQRLKKLKKEQEQQSQNQLNDEEIAMKEQAHRQMLNQLKFQSEADKSESQSVNQQEDNEQYKHHEDDSSTPKASWNTLINEAEESQPVVNQTQPKSSLSFLKKRSQQQKQQEEQQQQQQQNWEQDERADLVTATKKKSALDQIATEKKALKAELTRVVMKQHQLIQQQNALKRLIQDLKERRAQTVAEQSEFAENDNFEEAQNLEELIQNLTEQIAEAESEIMKSESDYNRYDSEKESLYASEIRISEGWLGALSENKKEKIKEKEVFETTQSQKLKNEKYEIEEATEQLRITQDHLNLDRRHLEEETLQITTNLNSQTGELTADQQRLAASKATLESEIAELREQLARKEEEYSSVNENLNSVTGKIKAIQLKFDQQLKRIDAKTQKLNEDEKVFLQEKAILENLVEQNVHTKQEMEDSMNNFDVELANLQTTRNELSAVILSIKQAKEERESALVRYRDTYAVYVEYKKTLVDDEEKLGMLVEEQSIREEQVNDLKARVTGINEKLPVLENEKKALVQQKKFKNAGTVAADIKELTTQMEDAIKAIEDFKQQELAHEIAVQEIEARKAESDKQLMELQRQVDAVKYKLLLIKMKDLKALLEFAEDNHQESAVLSAEVEETRREIEEIEDNLQSEVAEQAQQEEATAVDAAENQDEETNQQLENESEGTGLLSEKVIDGSVGMIPAEEQSIGSESSQQQTQADMDSHLKHLVEKIKQLKQEFLTCENDILHYAEVEDFEKAEEVQQKADELQVKIDELLEKLQLNFSCSNLEEAETQLSSVGTEQTEEKKNEEDQAPAETDE